MKKEEDEKRYTEGDLILFKREVALDTENQMLKDLIELNTDIKLRPQISII